MRTAFVIATILLGSALAQEAPRSIPTSQSFVPTAGQTFYLDLDTAEGAFSDWRHDDLGPISALRANISIPRIRNDRRWAPVFSLWLQDREAGHARNRVGLQLLSADRKPPLVVRVVQFNEGKLVATESFNRTIGLNENLAVEMVWRTPHNITIKIGNDETQNVSMPWEIDGVDVTASTGEMKVAPLVLGNVDK